VLQLAVAFRRGRVRLPVTLLIVAVSLAPFAPAVTDDLGVFRVSRDPLAVGFGAPTSLAL